MIYNKYKGFKMNSLMALRSICYECEKNMAINKTRCPFRSISNEFCEEYDLIKKDLEILEILKKNTIIIKDKEEYNKVKDWLIHNDL